MCRAGYRRCLSLAKPVSREECASLVESLGYVHFATCDHVVGVNSGGRPNWRGPYTSGARLHDVFAVFGFPATCTQRIELSTHALILPQRQTALAARQAASIGELSGVRLRLGIGIDRNLVEYIALNEDFNHRGKRSEDQAAVLRDMCTQDHVQFEGEWHKIPDAGSDGLIVVDIASDKLLDGAATGSRLANGRFLTPSEDRGVFYCTTNVVAHVRCG